MQARARAPSHPTMRASHPLRSCVADTPRRPPSRPGLATRYDPLASSTDTRQTTGDQNDLYFDNTTALTVDNTFQIAFPTVGMTSAFAVFLLLRMYERESLRWTIVALAGCVHGILILIPEFATQMGAAVVFGLVRTLQWGAYFHFLGNEAHYAASYYSRVLGYNNLVIAAVSDFIPYGFTALLSHSAHASHAGMYAAMKSVALGAFILAAGGFCLFLRHDERARPAPLH